MTWRKSESSSSPGWSTATLFCLFVSHLHINTAGHFTDHVCSTSESSPTLHSTAIDFIRAGSARDSSAGPLSFGRPAPGDKAGQVRQFFLGLLLKVITAARSFCSAILAFYCSFCYPFYIPVNPFGLFKILLSINVLQVILVSPSRLFCCL